MKKHIISLLIGLAGLIYAQVAIPPSLGNGTESDPYQIANLENLYWIAADTTNFHYHYIQTADINAAETRNWFVGDHDDDSLTVDEPMGWKSIGGYSPNPAINLGTFIGTYDGQNNTIDSLYINQPEEGCLGLFGFTLGSELKNLGLTNVNICGGGDAGALVGCNLGTIVNCFSTGNVTSRWSAGGLIGEGSGLFEKCYSHANVTGYMFTGGLIGYQSGIISKSYCTGKVTCLKEDPFGTGGFAGTNEGTIKNCYSSSNVEGATIYGMGGHYLHGGRYEDSFCFGNLSGEDVTGFSTSSDAPGCFWDVDATGVPEDSLTWTHAVGLSTAQMKTKQTFLDAGWDFVGESANGTEDIWDMDGVTNNGYPFLAWMPHPVAIAPSLGNGTESDPYQIANLENLYWIAADTLNYHYHYIQTADINAEETRNWLIGDHDDDPVTPDEPMGWKPIGQFGEYEFLGIFTGVYDGQNHIIDNLYINHIPHSFDESMSGLFGWAENAVIKNLGITNCTITGGSNSGILCSTFTGTIEDCFTTGTVSGGWGAGGLIGEGSCNIVRCYSDVKVGIGNANGGLVGYFTGGSIQQSFSKGTMNTIDDALGGTGGLVGTSKGNIINCFSYSDISGERCTCSGGFAGCQEGGSIENCYSYGRIYSDLSGGFEGSSYGCSGNVINCFWDTETSGVPDTLAYPGYPIGLTTAEMKIKQTFLDAGWDFVGESANGTEDIWDMDGVTNNGYPFLAWMSTTHIDNDDNLQPIEATLYQNYPNPFNPVTTIKFAIPSTQNVRLSIYNSAGQLVENLVNTKLTVGTHSVQFNADKLNSGIYFYSLETNGKRLTNKMLLIR